MSSETQPPCDDLNRPDEASFQREIRFAVVIYGGVSLAIYINGVVHQLLSMVRATSPLLACDKLTRVEKVYRDLARAVGDSHVVSKAQRPDEPGKVGLTADAMPRAEDDKPYRLAQRPTTKFVVDILSGTSAGGINAIYLAKALATGTSLQSLAQMWITVADINKLLNDKQVTPKYLKQSPPPSLLNSPWMYLKLLEALRAMSKDEKPLGPMVDDLDLYCTTTDLSGLPITLPLTDKGVEELRYKSDFWFQRRPMSAPVNGVAKRDDFVDDMDPFLAFVARCTSSFPIAFEPMKLDAIVDVLKREDKFKSYFLQNSETTPNDPPTLFGVTSEAATLRGAGRFAQTCDRYSGPDATEQVDFNQRPFADGGYLQNKPFRYAIETLKTRSATLPVDRKLIYIEPEPETITASSTKVALDSSGHSIPPNAIQNGLDALIVMPGHQAIQEDINSVVEWNASVTQLQRSIADMKRSVANASEAKREALLSSLAYDSYRELRLASGADQLACRIAGASHVSLQSSEGTAIRLIVERWRKEVDNGQTAAVDATMHIDDNTFLDLFDFGFCERAIRYARTSLQHLNNEPQLKPLAEISFQYQELANKIPDLNANKMASYAFSSWLTHLRFVVNPAAAKLVLPPDDTDTDLLLSATNAGSARRAEWLFQNDTSRISFILDANVAAAALKSNNLTVTDDHFFETTTAGAEARSEWLSQNIAAVQEYLTAISFNPIKEFVVRQFVTTYSSGTGPLGVPVGLVKQLIERLQQEVFDNDAPDVLTKTSPCWQQFQLQDVLVYPMIFGTSVGEFEPVDLFRISPRDTAYLTGTSPDGAPAKNAPLKGDSLDAFGGFLDQSWRLSDMLRGRLDGAERLITAVLPDSDPRTIAARDSFIKQAQEAIALDWVEFQESLNLPLSVPPEPSGLRDALKHRFPRLFGKKASPAQ